MKALKVFITMLMLGAAVNINAQSCTMTIKGVLNVLSETKVYQIDEVPKGTTFVYATENEYTKTVSFQIYDVTAGEILKSPSISQTITNGRVTFELALGYQLAKGHTFEAQFKEYTTMSTLNKVPVAEHNYKFGGTADVAVFSDVKVVSVTPSTDEFIKSLNTPITITFSRAIASLKAKAVLGQMSSTNIAESDITTSDNITWTIKLNSSYVSGGYLSLNIYADDTDGHRVTDERDGVGTPETGYLSYSWATTMNLPTPTLEQNNKTYTSVPSLTFKYEGIGLNQDKSSATWQNIVIRRDDATLDLNITEDMFSVSGDESVGGTMLTLTLPEPLTYNGTYTVLLPALAFVLGHDNSNDFNGAVTFTFTIAGGQTPTAIAEVKSEELKVKSSGYYNLNGQRISPAALRKGVVIINGKKVTKIQ